MKDTDVVGKIITIGNMSSYTGTNKKTGEKYEREMLNIKVEVERDLYGVKVQEIKSFVCYGDTAVSIEQQFSELNVEALKTLKSMKDRPNKFVYLSDLSRNKDADGNFYRSSIFNGFIELTKAQMSKVQKGLAKLVKKAQEEADFNLADFGA